MTDPHSPDKSEQLREALLDLARAHAHEHETSVEAEALLFGLRRLTANHGHVSMFDHFLSVLRGLISFEDAGILLAQEGGQLRTVASTSPRFDQVTWTTAAMLKRLSLDRARALFDVSSVPEWRSQPPSVTTGVTSALHVLLQEEPGPAILVCTHSERGFFGERHARLATRFAPLASHALASYVYTRQLERLNCQLNEEIVERQRAEDLAATRQAQVMNSAKMAAVGEMAGGVAHEINTPLAVIGLLAQQLREAVAAGSTDGSALDSRLAMIERTSLRIAKVVRSLLTLSRDADQDSPEPASVQSLIDDTLELCRERFKNHGVDLIVDAVPPDLTLTCRAPQISQVLLNLLNNAFDAVADASPKWVRVTVGAPAATSVDIAVTDSGAGIPDGIRQRIFQPFFTTKTVGKGVGLGLSISAALIEGHGGSLTIDPSSAHTRFVAHLPRAMGRGVGATGGPA
jgi:C4-dicarboxylate-specific signal transduction histidine kinase